MAFLNKVILHYKFYIAFTLLVIGAASVAIYAYRSQPPVLTGMHQLPRQQDWIDHGVVIRSGELGEWDYFQWGGFAASAIKHEGLFYLYYQGADGYRVEPDETVTGRSIGVASSYNGIDFQKFSNNPVLNWRPNQSGEEGAVSSAATLTEDKQIAIIYGANTLEHSGTVNADGRLALSDDGFHFQDAGTVLDRQDRRLWASGDELFPIASLQEDGTWVVFYLPNGRLRSNHLGVAWGDGPLNLDQSKPVRVGLQNVSAWGTAAVAPVGNDTYALFLNNVRDAAMTSVVHLFSLNRPQRLTKPVASYQFPGISQATYLLDSESQTWFMYYRRDNQYGVMTAPAGSPDLTSPGQPLVLSGTPVSHNAIQLSWEPADDPDTGVAAYQIWRNGQHLTTIHALEYTDTALSSDTSYQYGIRAINYHGTVGIEQAEITVRTEPDELAPQLQRVVAGVDTALLYFDEIIAPASAVQLGNFRIEPAATIFSAELVGNGRQIRLQTESLQLGQTYQLTLLNIADRSPARNQLIRPLVTTFHVSAVPGLIGLWQFDEVLVEVLDSSGSQQNGTFVSPGTQQTAQASGVRGQALQFDGQDDHGLIRLTFADQLAPKSLTLALWVKPAAPPIGSNPANQEATIWQLGSYRLFYSQASQFHLTVSGVEQDPVTLRSAEYVSGEWHHVSVTIDEQENIIQLYVDGQPVSSKPTLLTPSPLNQASMTLLLGTVNELPGYYDNRFIGMLDELYLFGRALAPAEVRALFKP